MHLEPHVPYNITVKAVNLAGSSKERQVYCFVMEGGSYFVSIIHMTCLYFIMCIHIDLECINCV